MMEPLVARSEDYNYLFFRRLIENVKQTKDAQSPEDDETNMVSQTITEITRNFNSDDCKSIPNE